MAQVIANDADSSQDRVLLIGNKTNAVNLRASHGLDQDFLYIKSKISTLKHMKLRIII
jgi:hypothetical protein